MPSTRARSLLRSIADRSVCLAVLLLLAAAGCAKDTPLDDPDGERPDAAQVDAAMPPGDMAAGPSDMSRPAEPITAPLDTWTWVEFPESTCDEGSPTGLGVNLSGGKDVLIYLAGGGGCYDYATCFENPKFVRGAFKKAQFESAQRTAFPGSLLDRTIENPAGTFSLFYVPYCTGDFHIGDRVATYAQGATRRSFLHKGRKNLERFLARIAATVPAPGRVLVAGSSAGGFGAYFNYDLVRRAFPGAKVSLLDDSGPPLQQADFTAAQRDTISAAWGLDQTLFPLCPGCQSDWSALVPILQARYPKDRMALLSFQQDPSMAAFFGVPSLAQYERIMSELSTQLLAPTATFRSYYVFGYGHVMLSNPGLYSSSGVPLYEWLRQLLTDDPRWGSVAP